MPKFCSGLQWTSGQGDKIHFWTDQWVDDDGPLINRMVGNVNVNVETRVSDMVDDSRNWNWQLLGYYLPWIILNKIASIHAPLFELQENMIF